MNMLDILTSRNKLGKAAKISQKETTIYAKIEHVGNVTLSCACNWLFKREKENIAVGFTTSTKFILAITKDLLYKENCSNFTTNR